MISVEREEETPGRVLRGLLGTGRSRMAGGCVSSESKVTLGAWVWKLGRGQHSRDAEGRLEVQRESGWGTKSHSWKTS